MPLPVPQPPPPQPMPHRCSCSGRSFESPERPLWSKCPLDFFNFFYKMSIPGIETTIQGALSLDPGPACKPLISLRPRASTAGIIYLSGSWLTVPASPPRPLTHQALLEPVFLKWGFNVVSGKQTCLVKLTVDARPPI